MKNGAAKAVLGLAFSVSFTLLAAAQGAPPPPSLYLMADIGVEVAKGPEYEAAFKALITALKGCGFPVVFDTYITDDSRYYVIYGLETGYGAVDGLHKAWDDAAAKIGPAKFQTISTRLTACELERVFRFWTFRTDLSFLPSPERLKPSEIGYYTWDYVWLVPGQEAEFEALDREWIALSAARKARDPFMTYQGGYGNAEPVYVWFEYGQSAADYALAEEKFWKSLGDAGSALSKRTRALIRKMETKTGRYRPDLSYAPAK
jgi:hypothetical protein